jgi:Putative polyhydroxyalkanoic acid system protein (PHA_gran_rgn)
MPQVGDINAPTLAKLAIERLNKQSKEIAWRPHSFNGMGNVWRERAFSKRIARSPKLAKSLIVSLPHDLGKVEATRRLKTGLARVGVEFRAFFAVSEETWVGDRLYFRVHVLKQEASGTIDVGEHDVRVEVMLPWLLARLAQGAQTLVQKRGALLLEKK